MITREEYEAAVHRKEEAEKILQDYGCQLANEFDSRWARFETNNEFFTDDELVYAAYTRCKLCGEGVAYPKGAGPWHQWTCSKVLKGIGTDKGHDAFPFNMYEIKSEMQPSANGATTRKKSE